MKKADKEYLDACLLKFKEIGLEAEVEVSYGFGEGCYDIMFRNGGYTFESMQLSWTNAEKAKEEWGGYTDEEKGIFGDEDPGAAWQIADEVGHGLLGDDEYHTEDFEEIIEVVKKIIGAPKLFDTNTVKGLRDYLSYLIEEGKGAYNVIDYKSNELMQHSHTRLLDKYEEFMINARFEDFENN